MGIEDARKYLKVETSSPLDELLDLYALANTTASTLRILNDELGCGIPESSQSSSWKFRCPWGLEHQDGGLDKAARFYWSSDHAYCFALHGTLDPVVLRSLMWGRPKRVVAQQMVDAAGLGRRRGYRERISDVVASREESQRVSASPTAALASLRGALSASEGFLALQYTPGVQGALQAALDLFDPRWDFFEIQSWIEESKVHILNQISQEGSHG